MRTLITPGDDQAGSGGYLGPPMFAPDQRVPDLRLSLNESLHMVHREDWNAVARQAGPYLQYDHLLAIEDRMRPHMEFRYVVYYCMRNKPAGIACFQVVELEEHGSPYGEKIQRLGKHLGSRVLEERRVRCLVAGNVFHTGDHGSYFLHGVGPEQRLAIVADTLLRLEKGDSLRQRTPVLLMKDIVPPGTQVPKPPKGFHLMRTDAIMEMTVHPAWKSLDDYMGALNAKSRTRLKNVLKRSAGLEVRSLDPDAIEREAPRLQRLLDNILARSPYVLGRLNAAVFADHKRHLRDALLFNAYYVSNDLVGFSSAFVLDDALDAHYVGLDHAHNERFAVYQRMLVDHLASAIALGLPKVLFGRTAEQAKSNLGATPTAAYFYVRHRNPVVNRVVGPFLHSVQPSAFELRDPFKETAA